MNVEEVLPNFGLDWKSYGIIFGYVDEYVVIEIIVTKIIVGVLNDHIES